MSRSLRSCSRRSCWRRRSSSCSARRRCSSLSRCRRRSSS